MMDDEASHSPPPSLVCFRQQCGVMGEGWCAISEFLPPNEVAGGSKGGSVRYEHNEVSVVSVERWTGLVL